MLQRTTQSRQANEALSEHFPKNPAKFGSYRLAVSCKRRQYPRRNAKLSGVKIGWLVAAASLHITGLLFSAVRWKILLRAQNIDQPIRRLFSYYIIGHFFNMFLPTQVGGDVVRIYDTSQDHGSTAQPLAVVMVERVSGMLTLLMFSAVVILIKIDIGFDIYGMFPNLNILILFFILGICLLPLFFLPIVEKILKNTIFKIPGSNKISGIFFKIFHAFQIYGGKLSYLAAAVLAGITLQLNYIIHFFMIAKALDIKISLAFFFVIIPIRSVTLMIPFFINGIGLREFFDVTAFNLVSVFENEAVAFSELAWLVQIFFALIGGSIYIIRRRSNPVKKSPS
jgi:glycosyltransferase 2 family protein